MSLPGPSGPPRKAGSLQNAAPVAHPQDNPRMNFNFPWRSSMPSPTEPGANPQPPIPLQIHPRMPDPPRPAAPRNAFSRGSNPAPPIPLQDLSRIPNHPQKAAPSNHPIHPPRLSSPSLASRSRTQVSRGIMSTSRRRILISL